MNEILIEDQQFEFLSDKISRPIAFIRRFSQGFNRFYYTLSPERKVTLYSSATTLIKDGYAEDTMALEIWRSNLKAEGKNPEYELNYAASRGTIMHTLLADYIQGISVKLSDIGAHLIEHHADLNVPYMNEVLRKDSDWLRKAILAFGQFVVDYNVKPVALELLMKSELYKVASPIDMICQMDIDEEGPWGEPLKSGPNKGQPKMIKRKKTIFAIVDFKSSKNGFFDKHVFQLLLYKQIVKENYPDLNIEGLFNWSPKDWRTSPTYNLKEQSDGKLEELADTVFKQGMIKHSWKTPSVTEYNDEVSITDFDAATLVTKIPLIEYLEKHHGEDNREKDRK